MIGVSKILVHASLWVQKKTSLMDPQMEKNLWVPKVGSNKKGG